MAKTVVALIERRDEADRLIDELVERCGCDRDDIGMLRRGQHGLDDAIGADTASGVVKGAGAGAAVGGAVGLVAGAASLAIPGLGPVIAAGPLASGLTGAGLGAVTGGVIGALTRAGVPEDDARYYEDGLRRGETVLTVDARTDEIARCAARVLEGGRDDEALDGARVVPVVSEELAVGKREVTRGGVRVHTRVIETPVEERVALQEERAQVERTPVDREAGANVFNEEVIEIRETAEEPVITKRARVVEEVVVTKQVTQREETVHETVRRTDVRVERIGDGNSSVSATPYTGVERRVRQRRVATMPDREAKNAPGTMEGSPGAAGGR